MHKVTWPTQKNEAKLWQATMDGQIVIGQSMLGRVAPSAARLTQEPEVPGSIPGPPHTFVSPSADSRRTNVSYWRKYVHEVLVNRFGGLSLPRKVWLG